MQKLEDTKLTVVLSEGESTLLKQVLNHAVQDPTEAAILALGEVFAGLASKDTALHSVMKTETIRYSKAN